MVMNKYVVEVCMFLFWAGGERLHEFHRLRGYSAIAIQILPPEEESGLDAGRREREFTNLSSSIEG